MATAKRDPRSGPAREREARLWIEDRTGARFERGFGPTLRDGEVLCQLANALRPGCVPVQFADGDAKKAKENVKNFTKVAKAFGIPRSDIFSPADLTELRDLGSVTNTILVLKHKIEGQPAVKEKKNNMKTPKLLRTGSTLARDASDIKKEFLAATAPRPYAGPGALTTGRMKAPTGNSTLARPLRNATTALRPPRNDDAATLGRNPAPIPAFSAGLAGHPDGGARFKAPRGQATLGRGGAHDFMETHPKQSSTGSGGNSSVETSGAHSNYGATAPQHGRGGAFDNSTLGNFGSAMKKNLLQAQLNQRTAPNHPGPVVTPDVSDLRNEPPRPNPIRQNNTMPNYIADRSNGATTRRLQGTNTANTTNINNNRNNDYYMASLRRDWKSAMTQSWRQEANAAQAEVREADESPNPAYDADADASTLQRERRGIRALLARPFATIGRTGSSTLDRRAERAAEKAKAAEMKAMAKAEKAAEKARKAAEKARAAEEKRTARRVKGSKASTLPSQYSQASQFSQSAFSQASQTTRRPHHMVPQNTTTRHVREQLLPELTSAANNRRRPVPIGHDQHFTLKQAREYA